MPNEVVEDRSLMSQGRPTATEFATNSEWQIEETRRRLNHAIAIGGELKALILKENLWLEIKGKPYVKVEGWNALFSMLGLSPEIVEAKKLDDGAWFVHGQLVKTDAFSNHARVISQAFAVCGDPADKAGKNNWAAANDNTKLSMAQTRCVAKLGRTIGGHIMQLAGYQATPAEEMMGIDDDKPADPRKGMSASTPPED